MRPHFPVSPLSFPIIFPTAVSGWRSVIIWTHLRPPACEELGFVRVVVVAHSHLVSNMLHVSYLMVWLLTSAG